MAKFGANRQAFRSDIPARLGAPPSRYFCAASASIFCTCQWRNSSFELEHHHNQTTTFSRQSWARTYPELRNHPGPHPSATSTGSPQPTLPTPTTTPPPPTAPPPRRIDRNPSHHHPPQWHPPPFPSSSPATPSPPPSSPRTPNTPSASAPASGTSPRPSSSPPSPANSSSTPTKPPCG